MNRNWVENGLTLLSVHVKIAYVHQTPAPTQKKKNGLVTQTKSVIHPVQSRTARPLFLSFVWVSGKKGLVHLH